MDLSVEKKKEIETALVEIVTKALTEDVLTEEDAPKVASFILDKINNVKTQEELLTFLRELSAQWSIFTPLLVIESGEVKEKSEEKAIEHVEALAEHGNIEEALQAAKNAIVQQQGT